MSAVAQDERPAPADAVRTSFNSTNALLLLMKPGNPALLALTRDRKPDSIAALPKLSCRAEPNLTRTIAKLEATGLVAIVARRQRASCLGFASKLTPTRNATRSKSPEVNEHPAKFGPRQTTWPPGSR